MLGLFVPTAIETKMDAPIGLYPEESGDGQMLLKAKLAGSAVIMVITAAAMPACSDVSRPQAVAAPTPVAGAAPVSDGLNELAAMTFSCPKAGLNAAAREAAEVPSQGTYQFAYFEIIDESHHSLYEAHFKSNYKGERDLKYCVSLYCQQGWDPKTTVTLISDEHQPGEVAAHGAECGHQQTPAKR
jgi:hypothetical protein